MNSLEHAIPRPLKNSIRDQLICYFEDSPTTFKLIKFAITKFDTLFFAPVFRPDRAIDCTSCIHTNYAINQIFLNQDQMNFFIKLSLLRTENTLGFSTPYLAINLFLGEAISQISKELPLDKYKKRLVKETAKLVEKFENQNQITPKIHSTKNFWRNYDFNLKTFNRFKDELKSPIMGKNTLIFNVMSREADIPPKSTFFFHAFSIEKFLNKSGEVCYRIYESWVDNFSLLDCLEGRGYSEGEEDEGCIKNDDIDSYLAKLEKVFCPSSHDYKFKHVPEKDILECFGYKCLTSLTLQHKTKYIHYNDLDKIVRGLTFFYTSWESSPLSSLENFANLIDRHEALKERWNEINHGEPARKRRKLS